MLPAREFGQAKGSLATDQQGRLRYTGFEHIEPQLQLNVGWKYSNGARLCPPVNFRALRIRARPDPLYIAKEHVSTQWERSEAVGSACHAQAGEETLNCVGEFLGRQPEE